MLEETPGNSLTGSGDNNEPEMGSQEREGSLNRGRRKIAHEHFSVIELANICN